MSAQPDAMRFNTEMVTRPLFGILLAVIGLVVAAMPAEFLAGAVVIGCIVAAREWHRCVGAGPTFTQQWVATVATVALAEAIVIYLDLFWPGVAIAVLGSVVVFILARNDGHAFWHAGGVLYLTLPALALVTLRLFPAHNGALLVIGLFLIIWSTDTGALVCGKLIGGPRMAPRLSPGKTWAGTIGGSVIAGLVYAGYVGFLGGAALAAALFAFIFSFTAHGGDLFESFVKRRFGLKNSGSAIPGHGGVLDRMDSTLAAAPAMALLVFVGHFNPLFGMHV